MRVVRAIVAVMFAATIAVTGCTAHQPAPSPPAPNPTHAPRPPTPRTDPNDPTRVDRQALIFTAVLRQYLTRGDHSFGDHGFPEVFVLDHTVAGAGAAGHEVPGGGPIPPAARRAIIHSLTDVGPLIFVTSADAVIVEPDGCAHVRDDGILGPVEGTGDRVGVNGFVACLGANSLTYTVRRTATGWMVGESPPTGRSPEAQRGPAPADRLEKQPERVTGHCFLGRGPGCVAPFGPAGIMGDCSGIRRKCPS